MAKRKLTAKAWANRPTAWRETPAGKEAYAVAKKEAQEKANFTGHDHGIEANDVFKSWHVFMLPMKQNRFGFELRCEVVYSMKPRKGHGL